MDGQGTLADQIYRGIKSLIERGIYKAGDSVPSSRELVNSLKVSRNTILQAIHTLMIEGYLESKVGSGMFVATSDLIVLKPLEVGVHARSTAQLEFEPPAHLHDLINDERATWMLSPREFEYDFSYGKTEFPQASASAWRKCQTGSLNHIYNSNRADKHSFPLQGIGELRQAIARQLALTRGFECDPDNIVITGGTQESISIAMRLLTQPGESVLLEDPCYASFKQLADLYGAVPKFAKADDNGIRIHEVEATNTRLAVVTPSHQFPMGGVLSAGRRVQLYKWAVRNSAFIIEDDYDGEFRYDTRPIAALKSLDTDGRVVYLGSFSKTMFPGLRLGYVVLPPSIKDAFLAVKLALTGGRSETEQLGMAQFIHSGEYQKHLNRTRKIYRQRRQSLLNALDGIIDKSAISGSAAGLHLLIKLPTKHGAKELFNRLIENGIGVTPVIFPNPRSPRTEHQLWLTLSYGGIPTEKIAPGVAALAAELLH